MKRSAGAPSRQRGQVMPMTILFIAAVILALWVMYDSGQVATERMSLQNTADAVAFSSATMMSRDLNFIAYTNRAMVANQVAIAQMVGLSSWMAMMNQFGHNVDAIGDMVQWFVPYGSLVKEITAEIESVIAEIAEIADALARVVIPANEVMIDLLSQTQLYYHGATLTALGNFSRDIAKMNDADAKPIVGVAGFAAMEPATAYIEWSKLIGDQNELHRVSDNSEPAQLELRRYREFEQVVIDSRDRFSSERSYRWPGLPAHPWEGVAFPEFRWRTPKYGGTDLIREVGDDDKYRWSWAGMDTVSLWFSFYECGFDIPPCKWSRYQELIPIAWGGAHALPSDASSDYFEYGGGRRDDWRWGNGTWRNDIAASMVANSSVVGELGGYSPFLDHSNHRIADIDGLRKFYDFRRDGAIDTGPAVIAFYRKDANKLSSQRTMITAHGGTVADDLDTEAHGTLVNSAISAVAKAEPYFARPTDLKGWGRSDGKYEHGNLYNPFWQPRLIDLSDTEKAAATAAAGFSLAGGS